MNHLKTVLLTFIVFILFSCGNDKEPKIDAKVDQNPVEFLTSEIVKNPNNPELYFKRAEIFYENETYQDAVDDLSKAVALDSNKFQYYHLLADVYLDCLLYTSPSPRDATLSRMPSSA